MAWAFYLVWLFAFPLAVWAVVAPRHYYKTFKPLVGVSFWFLPPDKEEQRAPVFIRILGVLVLLIMGLQVYVVTSGAMRL